MRRILEWLGLLKDRKTKLSEDLNAMKLVERGLQAQHATEQVFRGAHKHRIAEWKDVAVVLDTETFGPDSAEGRAFLEGLNNNEIHKIATELNWDGPNAPAWRLAFVDHPNFDKATA